MRQRQRLRLRQGHHLRALEQPAQVAVLRPLKDNVQLVAVDEGSFKPDDTRVRRQRLQQLDLLDAPLSRLRIHRVEDRDLLQRDSPRVRIAGRTVHDGEVAAADGLLHCEVVQRAAAEVEARRAGGAIGHALQREGAPLRQRVLPTGASNLPTRRSAPLHHLLVEITLPRHVFGLRHRRSMNSLLRFREYV